ncbi:hypothetical protein BU24DRAFT_413966 [Aaosphaeria arxii CBS 175.79]|uniref:Uncharacterized protein n=1 Tax=Aaosphaeria arxii CBS 175.79 TaxID=1450172 RepID=A0A6A5XBT9_9PLEO|nr:uncharacterized protein BU24DRAFT_413966 [Aaosphaeria arxii CBS 175.79]KAF2010370.1 hypothetical protein BU24DRAFT_413966 [Aaosphaeria arxii CBS 175.79]
MPDRQDRESSMLTDTTAEESRRRLVLKLPLSSTRENHHERAPEPSPLFEPARTPYDRSRYSPFRPEQRYSDDPRDAAVFTYGTNDAESSNEYSSSNSDDFNAHDLTISPSHTLPDMTTTTTYYTTPNTPPTSLIEPVLAHARALKAHLSTNTPLQHLSAHPSPPSSRRKVEDDPENIIIKDLRQNHHMSWGGIANYLNARRLERGEPQSMTQPAVYSRFVRNAPKIAMAGGEGGFDVKDYMHLRHASEYPVRAGGGRKRKRKAGEGEEGDGGEDGDVDGEGGEKWQGHGFRAVRVMSKLDADSRELETAVGTGHLVDAVAVVQRGFWGYVADELERSTGKFYDPKAIESRWKEI